MVLSSYGRWKCRILKCGLNLGGACKEHRVGRGNRIYIPVFSKERESHCTGEYRGPWGINTLLWTNCRYECASSVKAGEVVVVQMTMAGNMAVGRPKIGRYLCSCVDEEISDKTIGSEGRHPSVVGTLARAKDDPLLSAL